jgi:hypothetical protein
MTSISISALSHRIGTRQVDARRIRSNTAEINREFHCRSMSLKQIPSGPE